MRFSRRTNWDRTENAFTQVVRRAREAHGHDLVDLAHANPTRVGLSYEPSILAALRPPEVLEYRAEPFGDRRARESVAAYYARRGINVDAERIVLTASTSEAYGYLFRLLLDPGDTVLVPTPSYPLFGHLADLGDAHTQHYRLAYDGRWHLDRSSLESIDERARVLLTVNPNNPSGSCVDQGERAFLREISETRGLALISDEVFADYTLDQTHRAVSWIGETDRLTFSLNGLSKAAGLPQMKLGWIVISGVEREVEEARARLEVICDTYLSVSTPAQSVLHTALGHADAWQHRLRERLRENREHLEIAARGQPFTVRASDGGWAAVLELPATLSDEAWASGLALEDGVLVSPGYLFDVTDRTTLVINLIESPDQVRAGVERLRAGVERRIAGGNAE